MTGSKSSLTTILATVTILSIIVLTASSSSALLSPYELYEEWEDAPASVEEFDHDNDASICGVAEVSVEEWEEGRYWERGIPVMVKNVTAGWKALEHWKKQEMVRRYGNAPASMGEARLVAETGPDEAGKRLTATTLREFVLEHMYDPRKYFFDRKISIPEGMLLDCHPFPQPTRSFLDQRASKRRHYTLQAPSKKRAVLLANQAARRHSLWRDHLAISIGADLQGFTFHHHNEAWNVVLFGKKRWILWDSRRAHSNTTRMRRMTRDWDTKLLLNSSEWLRQLYPHPERQLELRLYGHDCVQKPGTLMFVPRRWMHMVLNIGDTVAVISEVGLGAVNDTLYQDWQEDDYLMEQDSSDDDDEDEDSSDDDDDDDNEEYNEEDEDYYYYEEENDDDNDEEEED